MFYSKANVVLNRADLKVEILRFSAGSWICPARIICKGARQFNSAFEPNH